ncbi:MAG TPA: hypothetical protein VFE24_14425 [Pirellulales bacterium]|nr:hypothetical protein [Pirellulales bacterium]
MVRRRRLSLAVYFGIGLAGLIAWRILLLATAGGNAPADLPEGVYPVSQVAPGCVLEFAGARGCDCWESRSRIARRPSFPTSS